MVQLGRDLKLHFNEARERSYKALAFAKMLKKVSHLFVNINYYYFSVIDSTYYYKLEIYELIHKCCILQGFRNGSTIRD